MTKEAWFNLSAFAEKLRKESRDMKIAGQILRAVELKSIETDLLLALEASEELTVILDDIWRTEEIPKSAVPAALIWYIIVLYARATKTSSNIRKKFDLLRFFSESERAVHDELCNLRDDAVAHFGHGGPYGANWVVEIAVLHVTETEIAPAVVTRRLNTQRDLLERAKIQIVRCLEIISPICKKKIDEATVNILERCKNDTDFMEELRSFPINISLVVGGPRELENLRRGKLTGRAKGAFFGK
jgi:hypothetical protein